MYSGGKELRSMKLSQLEQIIEVANTGTISQAAINLFVSQPNLSLSIKRAEDELGTKLFNRTSTGMTLTPHGVDFVDRAKEILQQIDALSDVCRGDKALFPLELNVVSISHRIVDIEVAKLLKRYDQNFVKVNLQDAAGIRLLDAVADNRAELKNLFRKSLILLGVLSLAMTLSGIGLAKPFSGVFVGYDPNLMAMTVRAFMIYALSFLLCGFNIFGSAMFTALNNGVVSAVISFIRTLVCQTAAVLLLPLIFDLDGIWASIVAAEFVALLLTVFCFVKYRKRYHYA